MSDDKQIHDVEVVGAGPAALSAAIYTTREDIDTLLFERGVPGGLAAVTDWVDNYPGFPDGLAGLDLAEGLRKQAERFYARGVHYCATCDGAFYREKRLVVVGGGSSAVQEAMFLTRFATHIDLLVRSTVKASEVLQQELQKFVDNGKVTVHLGVVPTEIIAE